MIRTAITLLCLAFAAPHALAADALEPGKYTGAYDVQTRTGSGSVGVDLDIKEVKAGKVKAVALVSRNGACDGEYTMEGTYKAGKLSLKATQRAGRSGDCNFGFTASPDGNKLVGKTAGGRALTLAK
jgi:hypothetical protein